MCTYFANVGPFVLVTFKPRRREERFSTRQMVEERAALLQRYGIKFRIFEEETKLVRKRLTPAPSNPE